jgi:ankyrin repeat protein
MNCKFLWAAERGDVAELERLVDGVTNINYGGYMHKNCAYRAAEHGHIDALKYLLQLSIDFNCRCRDGSTPLIVAIRGSHLQCAKVLLECMSVDVNAADMHGATALHEACMRRDSNSVLALVSAGADVYARDRYGHTALMRAAGRGADACVRTLLDKDKRVACVAAHDGMTPLHAAAAMGSAACVQLLVEANAPVDAAVVERGTRPLHLAARRGDARSVQLLVGAGADVDARTLGANDDGNDTPLHFAAARRGGGDLASLVALLDAGAAFDVVNNRGMRAIDVAADAGNERAVVLLLDRRQPDDNDWLAKHTLRHATRSRQVNIVRILVDRLEPEPCIVLTLLDEIANVAP